MNTSPLLNCLLSTAACLCLAMGLSISAQSQTASPAAQPRQDVHSKIQLDVGFYGLFLDHLGREDDEIQMALLEGREPTIHRPDYAEEIGISEDEMQTVLGILIDAYCQGEGLDDPIHKNLTRYKLVQQYGPDEGQRKYDEVPATYDHTKAFLASKEALVKLQAQLGAASLSKLNGYVEDRRWVKGTAWERKTGWVTEERDPDPCPANNYPPPGQTTHVACTRFYDSLFDEIFWDHVHNENAKAGNGGERSDYAYLPSHLSRDKKQAVIDLAIATHEKLGEANHQYLIKAKEAQDQKNTKYGYSLAYEMPDPPEVEALAKRPAIIVEESIFTLRQELGDDDFMRLDADLDQRNKTIRKDHSAPSSKNAPTSDQAPAVKP